MALEKHEHVTDTTREEKIRGLVEQLDAYISYYHGGHVEFCGVEDEVVRVRMGGACSECSLQQSTLRGWWRAPSGSSSLRSAAWKTANRFARFLVS